MKTIFLKELKRTRISLFIWCLVIGSTALFGMLEYPFVSKYMDTIAPLLQTIPKLVQIMFGVYGVDLSAPIGYYVCMYFWCGLIVYAHSIYIGSDIIAKDERNGTSEYLYTKPYRRSTIVTAKILAAAVNALVVAVVSGGISAVAMIPMNVDAKVFGQVGLASVGMFLTQLVFVALGLLCSAIFKKYPHGILAAVGVLVTAYAGAIFIEYMGTIDFLNFLSPVRYFNVQTVIKYGISPIYLLISALVISLSLYFTLVLYQKRDFHS